MSGKPTHGGSGTLEYGVWKEMRLEAVGETMSECMNILDGR